MVLTYASHALGNSTLVRLLRNKVAEVISVNAKFISSQLFGPSSINDYNLAQPISLIPRLC